MTQVSASSLWSLVLMHALTLPVSRVPPTRVKSTVLLLIMPSSPSLPRQLLLPSLAIPMSALAAVYLSLDLSKDKSPIYGLRYLNTRHLHLVSKTIFRLAVSRTLVGAFAGMCTNKHHRHWPFSTNWQARVARSATQYITKTVGALYEFLAFLYKQNQYASYSRIT